MQNTTSIVILNNLFNTFSFLGNYQAGLLGHLNKGLKMNDIWLGTARLFF